LSRGKKKHKRKDKDLSGDGGSRPEKVRVIQQEETSDTSGVPPKDHLDEKPPPEPSPNEKTYEIEETDVIHQEPPPPAEKHRRKHKHRDSKK
jgi:hypothetical protein